MKLRGYADGWAIAQGTAKPHHGLSIALQCNISTLHCSIVNGSLSFDFRRHALQHALDLHRLPCGPAWRADVAATRQGLAAQPLVGALEARISAMMGDRSVTRSVALSGMIRSSGRVPKL